MADKVDKPKKSKAKPKKDEKNVLGSLSATRPDRIGTGRASATRATATTAKPAPARTAAGASTKRPARATAARRKAAAPRTFEPIEAAESAAGAADERAAGAVDERAKSTPGAARSAPRAARPQGPEREPRPRAVREGAPGMGTSDVRDQPSPESARPSGMELVTTAVQAAGELAQIGLTIGGRILKRAVDRLPRP